MKIFASLILTLFCACFVCAQEKELPQAEIQQMYIDYFHSEIDAVKGMSPSEKQELYDCVDSLIKKYQIIPNRGNNTLRKLNFFKKYFPMDKLFVSDKVFLKYNIEQKRLYLEVTQKIMTILTQMLMTQKLMDEEKTKAMEVAFINFEKSMVKALMKMLKRNKNLDYDIQRARKWISEGREKLLLEFCLWSTDTSYATIKWKQLHNVDHSFFEKNKTLLIPTVPYSFTLLLEKRIGINSSKREEQIYNQIAQNMGLTLPQYMKKIQEVQELHRKINNYNKQM